MRNMMMENSDMIGVFCDQDQQDHNRSRHDYSFSFLLHHASYLISSFIYQPIIWTLASVQTPAEPPPSQYQSP